MSKIERLYHLHNILSERRTPISRHVLMERLECSQATLYRLIAELRDFMGAPIEQDGENRGFYYDRSLGESFELPGIWISPQELQALLTAREVLGNVQPGLLEDELSALQTRISSLLAQKGVGADEQQARIHIQSTAGRPVPAHMFQDVLGALFNRKRLWLRYHGRINDAVSEREVSPQRLTQHRNSWYLDAWCHSREGLRSFALERILDQRIGEEQAVEIPLTELSAHYDDSYGIFSGPAQYVAELLFTPTMSRWVADEQWHAEQHGELMSDGCYRLKVPFSNSRELVMDILRFGVDVEVLAPDFLREQVSEMIRQTLQIYR